MLFAEESLIHLTLGPGEIPRFARNDNKMDFFSSLFSRWRRKIQVRTQALQPRRNVWVEKGVLTPEVSGAKTHATRTDLSELRLRPPTTAEKLN